MWCHCPVKLSRPTLKALLEFGMLCSFLRSVHLLIPVARTRAFLSVLAVLPTPSSPLFTRTKSLWICKLPTCTWPMNIMLLRNVSCNQEHCICYSTGNDEAESTYAHPMLTAPGHARRSTNYIPSATPGKYRITNFEIPFRASQPTCTY